MAQKYNDVEIENIIRENQMLKAELEQVKLESSSDRALSGPGMSIVGLNDRIIQIDAENKSANSVQKEIHEELEKGGLRGKIVLLRIAGTLKSGLPSEINFNEILAKAKKKGAKTVKKSIGKLCTKEFEEVKIIPNMSTNELEKT